MHSFIYSAILSTHLFSVWYLFFLIGFELGSTVQSKTKGIWVWCVPHPTRKNCCVVLLDTEGLGDVEKVTMAIYYISFYAF